MNGTKKVRHIRRVEVDVLQWITNGHWADYFSTGCKTDKGLTMILIPRGEGVETKIIKSSYSSAAGTACVVVSLKRL